MFRPAVLLLALAFLGCGKAHTGSPSKNVVGGNDNIHIGSLDVCSPDPSHGFDPVAARLPACCTDIGGAAHCVAAAHIPASLAADLAMCSVAGGAGYCVPDKQIRTGVDYQPAPCTASIVKAAGVCLSLCIAAVANNPQVNLLNQDGCDANEVCVPCVNPFTQMPTGACKAHVTTCGADGGTDDAGDVKTANQ